MAEIIRFCDVENLQKKAANLIKTALSDCLSKKSTAIFAICGGSSVAGIFTELAELDIEWGKVHFFMADERLVPIDDPESNYKLAFDTLLGSLLESGKLDESNLHPFRTDLSVEEGLELYNREFSELGGQIAVSLLSAGPDGHIASLFPDHPSISDSNSGFIAVDNSPKPPAKRISASRRMLEQAGCNILIVAGQAKAHALANATDDSMPVEQCPARIAAQSSSSFILTDIK